MALLYEDYIKIRDAKVGDVVILADGSEMVIDENTNGGSIGKHHSRCSKNVNLDFYDRTYEG